MRTMRNNRRRNALAVRTSGDVSARRRQLSCVDVARSRAARYARQHRIARLLWPFMGAIIFVALIFDRNARAIVKQGPFRVLWKEGLTPSVPIPLAREEIRASTSSVDNATDGSADGEEPQAQHRPPASFLLPDVVDVTMSLIRNKGRIDTEPVRMRWRILDEMALPLAVYLRDIEERNAWRELDAETLAVPEDRCAHPTHGRSNSLRYRKVLTILPNWVARGEALMSGADLDHTFVGPIRELDPERSDNPDTSNWKP